jgi:large subunit ribosomal protein L13
MKTFAPKPQDVSRQWYLLDASELPLGRLATMSARLLLGKNKPRWAPHFDNGDYVIVINASSMVNRANKQRQKAYYRHSGFPGGLHKRSLAEQLALDPAKVVAHAVRGMLPDNKLRSARLKRLKIYADGDHEHTAQTPTKITLTKA